MNLIVIDIDKLYDKTYVPIDLSGLQEYDLSVEWKEVTMAEVKPHEPIEVVRCKDCTFYGKSPFGHATIGWCKIFGNHRNPDWFCANGEKKIKDK